MFHIFYTSTAKNMFKPMLIYVLLSYDSCHCCIIDPMIYNTTVGFPICIQFLLQTRKMLVPLTTMAIGKRIIHWVKFNTNSTIIKTTYN